MVDPGANTVMGQIKGKGRMSLELTNYFFQLLRKENIPTHLVAMHIGRNAMEVKEAFLPGKDVDGKGGLEFVCRRRAYGSFIKRYRKYVKEELQNLNHLVEITLKDDERGDPLINDDTIVTLGLLSATNLKKAKDMTRRIAMAIEDDILNKDLVLVDMKVEFGLINNEVVLIDEISADSMRVVKDGKILAHEELYRCIIAT